jgi:hypothetical protein
MRFKKNDQQMLAEMYANVYENITSTPLAGGYTYDDMVHNRAEERARAGIQLTKNNIVKILKNNGLDKPLVQGGPDLLKVTFDEVRPGRYDIEVRDRWEILKTFEVTDLRDLYRAIDRIKRKGFIREVLAQRKR